jgi:hypothetical protein
VNLTEDALAALTHWSAPDVLAAFGVEVEPRRVVVDRNRITGGGVIDAGSPEGAGPEVTALARSFIEPVDARTLRIARTWRHQRQSA